MLWKIWWGSPLLECTWSQASLEEPARLSRASRKYVVPLFTMLGIARGRVLLTRPSSHLSRILLPFAVNLLMLADLMAWGMKQTGRVALARAVYEWKAEAKSVSLQKSIRSIICTRTAVKDRWALYVNGALVVLGALSGLEDFLLSQPCGPSSARFAGSVPFLPQQASAEL